MEESDTVLSFDQLKCPKISYNNIKEEIFDNDVASEQVTNSSMDNISYTSRVFKIIIQNRGHEFLVHELWLPMADVYFWKNHAP